MQLISKSRGPATQGKAKLISLLGSPNERKEMMSELWLAELNWAVCVCVIEQQDQHWALVLQNKYKFV